MFHYCWLIDASSLDFLDLSAREFHEKSNATLLSALNLCIHPRRYSYSPTNADLSTLGFLSVTHMTAEIFRGAAALRGNMQIGINTDIAVSSNMKLIKIFTFKQQEDLILNAVKSCFFSSFTRNILERLAINFKPEGVKLYLKQIKTFFHYIEETLYPASLDYDPNIITFEKPCLNYNSRLRSLFIETMMKEIAPKLIKMLVDKVCADSAIVVEVLDTICFPCMNKANLFFGNGAEQMEYIFYHLRKVNYNNFVQILEDLQKDSEYDLLLRSKPEHLRVLLNCGVKIAYKPIVEPYDFFLLVPPEQREPNSIQQENVSWFGLREFMRRISMFFRRETMVLTPREDFIVEIVGFILTWSVPFFTFYLESLRLIWRSIPDAYLSYKEMRRLLLRYTDHKSANDICDQIQKHEFDSFDINIQPRTLLHYSRCALRKALMCSSQMPDGIELLRLPDKLKSYLKLKF